MRDSCEERRPGDLIRPALGTENEGADCFGAESCSAAGWGEGRWWQDMGLESAVAWHMDIPMSPGGATCHHGEIAAWERRE